jgi:exosortase/archaeosortase family protein
MITRKRAMSSVHPALVALGAAGGGALLLKTLPWLETDVFIAGAARLAGLLTGVPTMSTDEGWALFFSGQPVLVTVACSATDFFLMTVALCGWHFAQGLRPALLLGAAAGALVVAVPVALFINALRLIAVAQAHRWVIPRLPPAYGSFLHMFTGAVVFLTALIVLNLLLEIYGRSRTPHARN